jgi:replication factor C subunit 3/5
MGADELRRPVISALKTERGLALPDLLNGAFEFIDGLQLKPAARVYLLDILATIECVVSSFASPLCEQTLFR